MRNSGNTRAGGADTQAIIRESSEMCEMSWVIFLRNSSGGQRASACLNVRPVAAARYPLTINIVYMSADRLAVNIVNLKVVNCRW